MSLSAKKRKRSRVNEGVAHIKATFNNTIVSITDTKGDVICHASAGQCGFKNSRKSTPYAAQLASKKAADVARDQFDMKRLAVIVKGAGPGRESAIRGLKEAGLQVTCLKDATKLPHNGCRPSKKRRV
jgi:small subunit ribosomal protein S11